MNLFEEIKRIYIPISKKKFKRRFMDLSEIAMIADIIFGETGALCAFAGRRQRASRSPSSLSSHLAPEIWRPLGTSLRHGARRGSRGVKMARVEAGWAHPSARGVRRSRPPCARAPPPSEIPLPPDPRGRELKKTAELKKTLNFFKKIEK